MGARRSAEQSAPSVSSPDGAPSAQVRERDHVARDRCLRLTQRTGTPSTALSASRWEPEFGATEREQVPTEGLASGPTIDSAGSNQSGGGRRRGTLQSGLAGAPGMIEKKAPIDRGRLFGNHQGAPASSSNGSESPARLLAPPCRRIFSRL